MELCNCTLSHESLDSHALACVRSYLYCYVKMLAVDKVIIEVNSTQHCDDMLAHRLGLLLLRGKPKFSDALIKLHAKAEAAGPNYRKAVTIDDLHMPEGVELWNPYPDSPAKLAMLAQNDELNVKLSLREGRGIEHARFQPVRVARVECTALPRLHVEGLGNLDIRHAVQDAIDLIIRDLTDFLTCLETSMQNIDGRAN